MAIIVEDGSIVAGANSFVSRSEYITYAAELGVTVADDVAADIELIKAAQFIASFESKLKGALVDRGQPLPFPRKDLWVDGFSWLSTEIPRQVILCQMAVALDINQGVDPYNPPANPNRATRREKIDGAVEVEYFGTDGGFKMSRTSTWAALLSSLMVNSGLYSIALERA